jgi:hypothetical protein
MNRQSKNAQRIAEQLAMHRRVRRVRYPSLFDDPEQIRIRDAQTDYPGSLMSLDIEGGKPEAFEFLHRFDGANLDRHRTLARFARGIYPCARCAVNAAIATSRIYRPTKLPTRRYGLDSFPVVFRSASVAPVRRIRDRSAPSGTSRFEIQLLVIISFFRVIISPFPIRGWIFVFNPQTFLWFNVC